LFDQFGHPTAKKPSPIKKGEGWKEVTLVCRLQESQAT
jgi:hypothetical protein